MNENHCRRGGSEFFDIVMENINSYSLGEISVGCFIEKIIDSFQSLLGDDYSKEQARIDGWLEAQDVLLSEELLERRTAARIAHEFLKKVIKERDEENWQQAQRLLDLYDCRVCVNHVAQMYVKGIMSEVSPNVFGMREHLTFSDMEAIIEKLADRGRRFIQKPSQKVDQKQKQDNDQKLSQKAAKKQNHDNFQKQDQENDKKQNQKPDQKKNPEIEKKHDGMETEDIWSVKLSVEEALSLSRNNVRAHLIDVQVPHEYEEQHLDGAINCPMAEIVDAFTGGKPSILGQFKNDILLLYCRHGYQSEIAANCLARAGFCEVYHFGLNKNND